MSSMIELQSGGGRQGGCAGGALIVLCYGGVYLADVFTSRFLSAGAIVTRRRSADQLLEIHLLIFTLRTTSFNNIE
jgi:hypothetical protein